LPTVIDTSFYFAKARVVINFKLMKTILGMGMTRRSISVLNWHHFGTH